MVSEYQIGVCFHYDKGIYDCVGKAQFLRNFNENMKLSTAFNKRHKCMFFTRKQCSRNPFDAEYLYMHQHDIILRRKGKSSNFSSLISASAFGNQNGR